MFSKTKIFITFLLFFLTFAPHFSYAQTTDNSQAKQDLLNTIANLQNKISDTKGQEKTLSSQISVMDSQIKLTELRIEATKQQVNDLTLDIDTATKKIDNIQSQVDNLTKVLLNRIVATYEIGSAQQFQLIVSSTSVTDLVERANYLRIAQAHDKKLIYDTEQAKNDYKNQKAIYEEKKRKVEELKKQLESYTEQLNGEKASKQTLLTETQGSESNYQRLLSQAQAQLAGFSSFVSSQGGASLLGNQTTCDSWGCYYNQRDSQWGGNSLNGTGYTIASDGCLVTSMAMVYTHYGHRGVTPQTINSNSGNFASYYPAYLQYTITADGATSQRIGASIDGTLSSGNPVVVGVHAYGGTHFVVLKSGSNGDYVMNDPYLEGGHDMKFTDHYSIGSIFEIDKVIL